jgi:hypothetical protein
MAIEEWTHEKFRKGVYGDFIVYGIKYIGPRGEVGWHTTSWPNNNPIHDFWVIDSTFHHITGHIFDPQFGGRNSFVIGDVVENIDPAEYKAVMDAIEDWEKQRMDLEVVMDEEMRRLPANSGHAFEGRPNDLTIGSDGQRKGVRRPDNPEDRFD